MKLTFCDTRCGPEVWRTDFSKHFNQYDFAVAGIADIDFFINPGKETRSISILIIQTVG